jgi:hypothetical protein
MPSISDLLPYSDPGSLLGGVRQRVAEILGLQADVFRQASQSQSIVQSGRAFSGAQVTNEMTQQETLSQTATAENTKNVTITDASGAVPAGFNYNYLERVLTGVKAADFLSRSILNLNQRQRATQTGYSEGVDFQGNPSVVTNTLTQDGSVTNQTATSRINNNVVVQRNPDTENAARFRETIVDVRDILTEVGTVAVQDQGTAQEPSVQVGRANGGITNNTLNQNASGAQSNNAYVQNTIDVSETSVNNTLTPRSATVIVRIENDAVRNYGSVVQSQGLMQVAEGGVDEYGNPTENGGQVHNVGNSTATYTDNSVAMNTTSIIA